MFWCVKYWTCCHLENAQHSAPLGRLLDWPGCGGGQKSQSPLEELAFTVCVSCQRKTGLRGQTFGRLCCMWLIRRFGLTLLALTVRTPDQITWAGISCWEQGKHRLKSCQPLRAVALVCPQTSAHNWWGFSPGACSMRVAVAWEPVGRKGEWNNLIHKKQDLGASSTDDHKIRLRERSTTRKQKPYFNQFPLK